MSRGALLITLVIPLAACGSGGGGDGADASTDELTLASCTTSIADDVPAFYKTYFRCLTITRTTGGVTIAGNALPPHRSAYWGEASPNYEPFDTSRGTDYHQNPNLLTTRPFSITIPDDPVLRGVNPTFDRVDGIAQTDADEYPLGPVGAALDSVALFNAVAAPGDDIADERFTFDSYQAHPAPDGTYHYHAATPGPLEVLADAGLVTSTTPGDAELELYGILCDGTVVLGCTELDGSAPSGSLDAQGGHTHDLVDADATVHFTARYHAHVCPSSGGRAYNPELQVYSTCTR